MILGIAGAGMGGLAAATMLARDGHRVVLHDRMETPGPVGSGFVLQPTGLAVLKDMRLYDATVARGAPISRMLGLALPSGDTVLDVGYPEGSNGLAVQRAALFDILMDAAVDAGVIFETGRDVCSVSVCGHRFRIQDGSTTPEFDVLIDAMGSNSPLRSCRSRILRYGALWATVPWKDDAGFDPNTLEQRYFRASRMAGVLPVGTSSDGAERKATFFWSVRADEDPRRDVARWREEVGRF